jgi:hypothetical protein
MYYKIKNTRIKKNSKIIQKDKKRILIKSRNWKTGIKINKINKRINNKWSKTISRKESEIKWKWIKKR